MLARKIYPKNPEILAFWMDIMMDELIYGKSVIKIDPIDIKRNT